MLTTRRRFARIRAHFASSESAPPSSIRRATSISSLCDSSGIAPMERRYLLSSCAASSCSWLLRVPDRTVLEPCAMGSLSITEGGGEPSATTMPSAGTQADAAWIASTGVFRAAAVHLLVAGCTRSVWPLKRCCKISDKTADGDGLGPAPARRVLSAPHDPAPEGSDRKGRSDPHNRSVDSTPLSVAPAARYWSPRPPLLP